MKVSWPIIIGISILALVSTTSVVYADFGDESLIHACLDKKSKPRIVGPIDLCKGNETPIHWAIAGTAGDDTAPLVQLELPDKAFTHECLTIVPEVSDDTGISIVQLFINGVIGSSDIRSDPPFEFNRCGPGSPGFVEYKVLAWDFSGNVGSASSTVEFVIPDVTQHAEARPGVADRCPEAARGRNGLGHAHRRRAGGAAGPRLPV